MLLAGKNANAMSFSSHPLELLCALWAIFHPSRIQFFWAISYLRWQKFSVSRRPKHNWYWRLWGVHKWRRMFCPSDNKNFFWARIISYICFIFLFISSLGIRPTLIVLVIFCYPKFLGLKTCSNWRLYILLWRGFLKSIW